MAQSAQKQRRPGPAEDYVENSEDVRNIFTEIRSQADQARQGSELTALYRWAGRIITMTDSPGWQRSFGKVADQLRQTAEAEFPRTVRHLNQRAEEVGADVHFDAKWETGTRRS